MRRAVLLLRVRRPHRGYHRARHWSYDRQERSARRRDHPRGLRSKAIARFAEWPISRKLDAGSSTWQVRPRSNRTNGETSACTQSQLSDRFSGGRLTAAQQFLAVGPERSIRADVSVDRSDLTDYHAENAEGNMHYPGWLPLRDFCGVYEELARKNGSPNFYGSAPWEKLFGNFFFYEGWQYRVIFWMDSPWDEDSLAENRNN
jgi:hypothetical protein